MKTYKNQITSFILMFITLNSFSQNCVQCSGTIATGETSSAIGINNIASGKASFAGGIDSEAVGMYSLAFGDSAKAWSRNSIALGKHVSIFGAYSFGVGENVKTNSTSTMVIGSGYDDYNPLVNGINKSLMIGFSSNKSTLFIGGATANGLTGKIGIGDVTDPQSKLHIRADNGEAAELYLEPYQFGVSTGATLWLGTKQYGMKATYGKLEFKTSDNGRYVFNEGNVGIGTANPTQILEVNGTFKTGGFMMAGGAGDGKVLTSDASGQAAWTDSQWTDSGNNIFRQNGNVGIGTSNPTEKFEIDGNIRVNSLVFNNPDSQENFITEKYEPLIYGSKSGGEIGGSSSLILQAGGTPTNNNRHIYIRTADQTRLFIHHNGNVGIGTTSTSDARLSVAGKIQAEEVKIVLSVPQSDHVFKEDYDLIPLTELDQYIKSNKHLPGVPSAAEFVQNGYNVGEMDDLLLRKIEELTLYIIQLQKEIAGMNDKPANIDN
ncbi:MAG: hypothetical protein ACNA7V_10945 [Bacteroidales bacterium]